MIGRKISIYLSATTNVCCSYPGKFPRSSNARRKNVHVIYLSFFDRKLIQITEARFLSGLLKMLDGSLIHSIYLKIIQLSLTSGCCGL